MKTHAEPKTPTPSRTSATSVPNALTHQAQLRSALLRAGVQPRLEIGAVNDPLEREADAAAARVMRMPFQAAQANLVQTKASPTSTTQPSPQLESSLNSLNSGGVPLDATTRAFFEPRFGQDFSQVRLHTDSNAAQMAESLNARAFTLGKHIAFGANQYSANTSEGRGLLGHELAHVVQQSRTVPALQPKLKITGETDYVTRAIALLNSGLFGYTVSVDGSGNLSISRNQEVGPPSEEQQALASRLTTVINDRQDVIMTVSAASATLGGSYATGDFDIADLETYGVAGLIHEIEEQYQKQVKSVTYGSETTGAHGEGIKAESEVRGARRGAENVISSTTNTDGTFNAVVEIPHTYPDGTIKTMVMTIMSNNIVSVTWK